MVCYIYPNMPFHLSYFTPTRWSWTRCSLTTIWRKQLQSPESTTNSTPTWQLWNKTSNRWVPAFDHWTFLTEVMIKEFINPVRPVWHATECSWWLGSEESCNRAAEDARSSSAGHRATRGQTLCWIWPQERRLSCGILNATATRPSYILWTFSHWWLGDSDIYIQKQYTSQSNNQHGPQCTRLHKDSLYLLTFFFLMGKCFIGINSA